MHNLDVDIQEYFEFQIKGHTYRFRQPTTEEIQLFSKMDTQDEEKSNAFSVSVHFSRKRCTTF